MSDTIDLPNGWIRPWVRHENGEIWTRGPYERPIAYRVGGDWMICGKHSIASLRAIVRALPDE